MYIHNEHITLIDCYRMYITMPRDIEYERTNLCADVQYPEGGIKCTNHLICDTILPDWWYDCKGRYLCTNCDMSFGTWRNEEQGVYKTGKGELSFVGDTECPVCLKVEPSVTLPNCDHSMCIECFKRCHFGDRSGEPEFPYSEAIDEEYEDDPENIKWKTHFPLIEKWDRQWKKWDDNRQYKYDNENNLRLCPLCRK